MEVYKVDFEAERDAREEQAQKIADLIQENQRLKNEIKLKSSFATALPRNQPPHLKMNMTADYNPSNNPYAGFNQFKKYHHEQQENPQQQQQKQFMTKRAMENDNEEGASTELAHKACPVCQIRCPDPESLQMHVETHFK